jgi:O-antigen/teichoic acid export membrane protein
VAPPPVDPFGERDRAPELTEWPEDLFGEAIPPADYESWPMDPFGPDSADAVARRWPADPFGAAVRDGPPRVIATRDGRGGGPGGDLSTLARGGALSLAGSVASSILGFALVVVITRGLNRTVAGILFEAIAMFTIMSNSVELGADTALVRTISRYRALHRNQDIKRTIEIALWPVLLTGGLAGLAMFLFAPQLAHVFIKKAPPTEAARYIRLFAPFLPLAGATTVALAGTRGFGTMLPYVAVQNVGIPLARPALIVFAVGAGLGAVAIGLAWAAPVAAGFVLSIGWLLYLERRSIRRHRRRSREPARPLGQLAGEFWRFAAPRGLAGIFQITVIWLDTLLVGALRSAREAAVYTAASRFVGIGTFALQAVGLAIAPQISGLLARRQERRAETVFQTATWWLMAPSWPMYVALAVFAPYLMSVFSQRYVSGATALVILSIAMLALVGTGNNKVVLLMGGGSGWNLGITAVSLTSNIVLSLVLIPRYGIDGAAVAFAVSIIGDNIATTVVVRYRMHLQPFGSGYVVILIGSAICTAIGLAARAWLGVGASGLAAFLAISTPIYVALLWRFRRTLQLPVLREVLRGRALGR